MKQIVFSGYLEKMYPEGIHIEGDSAAECISGLKQFPGFRLEDGAQHTVVLPEFGSRDALYAKTDKSVIHVVPIVVGAGGKLGQFFMVALGAVLIATGWGAGFGVEILGAEISSAMLGGIGLSLVTNGVVGMLMPQPEVSTASTEATSSYLPSNKNTTKAGTRIPLLFGRRRVWGHLLSVNITAGTKDKPAGVTQPPAGFVSEVNSEYVWSTTFNDLP